MLEGKKILIGITGSIAAYKIPLLVRLLKKQGAEVQLIMTQQAKDFVTPLTLSTLSNKPVLSEAFDRLTGAWNSHVELGLWADLFLLAPVTANTLAKMCSGQADNFLMTVYLSARCPVFFAPAMDLDMYKHESTQQNIAALQKRGHQLIAPVSGELASGLCGEGRMEEPEEILEVMKAFFANQQRFDGTSVLVTAGPTHEPIDPVRFIGNHSSGRMGIEIAKAFARQGGHVKLVLGPSELRVDEAGISVIPVTTAAEMYDAAMSFYAESDIVVMSAAVADYTPAMPENFKIKKSTSERSLQLVKTRDILKTMGQQKRANQFLVGFALETNDEIAHAKEKLHTKNLDLIVLNSMANKGAGFKHQTNQITILSKNGEQIDFGLKQKKAVAADILEVIYKQRNTSSI